MPGVSGPRLRTAPHSRGRRWLAARRILGQVARPRKEAPDPAERARLPVAALLGTYFSPDLPKHRDLVTVALEAAGKAQMKRLMIPIGASVCMGGLSTGDVAQAVATARPILDLIDDLPAPSIMAGGLVVTYTEAAVRAGASPSDQLAAVRRLGPVLQGDFNRLGLVLARLVQQHGEHRLAVQTVAACSRDGRSRFSREQIDDILDLARRELGDDAVDDVIRVDLELDLERSEIYRAMWSVLQPLRGELARAEETSG